MLSPRPRPPATRPGLSGHHHGPRRRPRPAPVSPRWKPQFLLSLPRPCTRTRRRSIRPALVSGRFCTRPACTEDVHGSSAAPVTARTLSTPPPGDWRTPAAPPRPPSRGAGAARPAWTLDSQSIVDTYCLQACNLLILLDFQSPKTKGNSPDLRGFQAGRSRWHGNSINRTLW